MKYIIGKESKKKGDITESARNETKWQQKEKKER
jgi:hypothetical protein